MEIYLVGGAVRDQLLGLPVKERDWVVVGATPQEMVQQNFTQVGRDFPVFLHPTTHEEYALARTERKIGRGYTNFICSFAPTVTLEEDLKRRDLTINAMAQTPKGTLIDPYGGAQDLKRHILRHVSSAFVEDPVRILRVARFTARLPHFSVAPATIKLMQQMVANSEVDALIPERVWQELVRALGEPAPERFFITLNRCHALAKLFPPLAQELARITKILPRVKQLSNEPLVRFAATTFWLNAAELKQLIKNYKLPRAYSELSLLVNKFAPLVAEASQSAPATIKLLELLDAYRRPHRFSQFTTVCLASNDNLKSALTKLQTAYELSHKVGLSPQLIAKTEKKQLRHLLQEKRVKALTS